MVKAMLRAKPVLRGAGWLLAGYLKLVRATNRFDPLPADFDQRIASHYPAIIAVWHGQHFMIPFAKRRQDKAAVMISRHGDGEINAAAVERFGILPIRGSGAQRRDQVKKRGGAEALRGVVAALESGASVTVTADVPKVARVAGRGIVKIAQISGRPILPLAVVTSRMVQLDRSWDRTSIGLPFGRCAVVFGEPIHVPRRLTEAETEAFRLRVQAEVDAVHARAYAQVGRVDRGANRPDVEATRQAAALMAA
jgi:lysophospholipid acyltransferase (LPLAT)-like uncharacterized protein